MAHLRIYIKRRSSRLCDPPALIMQTASTTKCMTRPLYAHYVLPFRPSCALQPLLKPDLSLVQTIIRHLQNGLRGRADLHHSLLFFVSVAERGAELEGKFSSVVMPTALCFAALV